MVKATMSLETQKFDLKSVEGGWVVLREMSYANFLKRRDMAMKMGMSGTGKDGRNLSIDMMQEEVTRFEFSICIADHNLEDENGRKLALSEPHDFAQLHPKIGQEISDLIAEMTQWEDPKSNGESSGRDNEDSDLPRASETDE